MRITAATPKRQHLVRIDLDDGQSGDIDKTVWEHSGLSVGQVLDDEEWVALTECSAVHRAREKALYYLSLRDYGAGELVQKLRQGGIDKDLAAQTVARLQESGLINDERYAAMLARDMSARKLYPPRRIAMALKEKGFDAETVAQAIEQLDVEEEQQALELLRKKGYNGTDDAAKRQKALGMLARFGFSYATAKRALTLLEEETTF